MLGGSSLFDVRDLEVSGVRVIEVRGEIALQNAKPLLTTFVTVAQENPLDPILLDLSQVQYIDVQGVHALEAFSVHLQSQQRSHALTASSYAVHRILDLMEVRRVIPSFESREAAINFLRSET